VPAAGLNPTPADNAVVNPPLPQVSWTASPAALKLPRFYGTNQTAVAAATTNSPLYLGETVSTTFSLRGRSRRASPISGAWMPSGFQRHRGAVWKFIVSPVAVSPQALSFKGLVGLPLPSQTISLTATAATALESGLGATVDHRLRHQRRHGCDGDLEFQHEPTSPPDTTPTSFSSRRSTTLQLPVILQLFNLVATKFVADPDRDALYALHPGSAVLMMLSWCSSTPAMALWKSHSHRRESHGHEHQPQRKTALRFQLAAQRDTRGGFDQPHGTRTLSLGTDVYKINAGRMGASSMKIRTSGLRVSREHNQRATLASAFSAKATGNSIRRAATIITWTTTVSGAGFTKYDMAADTFASVAGAGSTTAMAPQSGDEPGRFALFLDDGHV